MDDPHVIARATGLAIPLTIVAYFIARRILGPGGSRELERLKRAAGVSDGVPAAGLFLRDWLPWVIAPGLGAGAFIVVVVANRVPNGLSVSDIPKLEAGFVNGCSRRCVTDGADASVCESSCRCAFDQLRRRHSDDERFVAWFGGADRNEVGEEAIAARAACLQSLQSR
jgi:hypothetical protein